MSEEAKNLEIQLRRLEAVKTRKARLEGVVQSGKQSLEDAKAKAREVVGTDDLEVIRETYRDNVAKNKQAVASFEADITEIERVLSEIESQLA